MKLGRALRGTYCALTVLFLVTPMLIVVAISFSSAEFLTFPPPGFSLQWYRKLFSDPQWAETLLNSVEIVVPTGVLATACGTAAAFALSRARMRGRALLTALLMAPLVAPVIVVGAGIFGLFTKWQLNGSLFGFVMAHTVITIPYVISLVLASLSTISEQYERAALILGASPFVAFRRVVLPLMAPGVLCGLLFAMVVSFDELVVSLFISTPTFKPVTVQMWSDVMGDVDPTIAAIGSLLFAFSLIVLVVEELGRGAGSRP